MSIQHLLEKQREIRKEFYDAEMSVDRKDIADWWLEKISTIQEEIVQAVKEKAGELKLGMMKETEGGPLYKAILKGKKDAYNEALSDLSSWLEGETK